MFFCLLGIEMNIQFLFEISENSFSFVDIMIFNFCFCCCCCCCPMLFCYFHFRRFAHVRSIDFRWLAVMTSFSKKKKKKKKKEARVAMCVCVERRSVKPFSLTLFAHGGAQGTV
jgi:hypothetical protein